MNTLAFVPELTRCFPALHAGWLVALLVLLALAGPVLRAYLPHHQMLLDERVKDRVLSAGEARRQVDFLRSAASLAIILGALQLTGMLCDLIHQF